MACSITPTPQRCHGKAGAGRCRTLQSPDEVKQHDSNTPFYCRKHWRQAGRNQASPEKPLQFTATQKPADLAISLSRLSLGPTSPVSIVSHPNHSADSENLSITPEVNALFASPVPPQKNPAGFHNGEDLVLEPSNVSHLPTKFSSSAVVTRWNEFRAQKLKLPVYSNVIHSKQALYGTVETLPNGRYVIACQALKADGTTHCRRQVTIGKDPRRHDEPNDRLHWYCHIHRDKPHQAAQIREAIHH
ncbi:hypothetical protein IWQ62_005692, partial [Dispira parvispora]